ncbi:MAG: hypothetical protein B7Z66_09165 [Chromatiales bacterium 21-64-14]|nr:MAG: hypothetical protein B7Z66_09165 [Chromatiales bacterium 21-64-14]HQU15280.1 TolC family outer membrane protein [Gammaproteobacteria bacterium]
MNSLARILVSLSLLLVCTAGRAEDLMGVYQLAVRGDPQLQAADQARLAVRQSRPQSIAALLPSLGVNLNVNRSRYDNQLNGSISNSTNQVYGLQLTQTLFNWSSWVQLSKADSQIAESEANYAAAQQDLMVRVAERYFGVLKARANLKFVRADQQAIKRQLDQVRKRFQVGLSAITDVREAQASYDAAAAQEIVAQNQLDSAREALTEITGTSPGRLADLGEKLALARPVPEDMKLWEDTALRQNLRVLADRRAVDVAREEVARRRSGHYPTVDLVANTQYLDENLDGLFPLRQHDAAIGIQLNMPLYQGGLVRAQTQEAVHRYEESKDKLVQAQRQTVRQLRDAYRGVLAGISQVLALKQAVLSSETALEATEAGFKVGTRTIVDVLDFQRNLFRAKSDYAKARYDYLMSTLRLKQAAGTLSADDLIKVNRWLAQSP